MHVALGVGAIPNRCMPSTPGLKGRNSIARRKAPGWVAIPISRGLKARYSLRRSRAFSAQHPIASIVIPALRAFVFTLIFALVFPGGRQR